MDKVLKKKNIGLNKFLRILACLAVVGFLANLVYLKLVVYMRTFNKVPSFSIILSISFFLVLAVLFYIGSSVYTNTLSLVILLIIIVVQDCVAVRFKLSSLLVCFIFFLITCACNSKIHV